MDRIVDEQPDAADEPRRFLHRLADAIAAEIGAAEALAPSERTTARALRFRRLPEVSAVER